MRSTKFVLATVIGCALIGLPASTALASPDASADRSVGETVEDAMLGVKVKTALLTDLGFDAFDIDVTARGGVVSLDGRVDKRATAEQSEAVAKAVDGVIKVNHRVRVEAPKGSETPVADRVAHGEREVADALLESKVKMALLSEIGDEAFDVEVEATDGTVSLRGRLPDGEREEVALKTAKNCEGVTKVIDLIDS